MPIKTPAPTHPAADRKSSRKYTVLISDADQTCGVEEFSRLLAARLSDRARTHNLDFDLAGLSASLKDANGLLLNFPVVAWKKKLVEPLLAALSARLRGQDVIVILHEWAALDWKRRLVLSPVLLLATKVCFSAPEISAEFTGTGLSRLVTGNRTIVPIPPNLAAPSELKPGAFSERLKAERGKGRLILGQFGSIYPQKQADSLLAVAAELRSRGQDVFVAYAGSFIKGQDTVEQDFAEAVTQHDLADRVAVSGFIGTEEELFAIFREIDVFCYLLPDGLTARRGSVLAAAASGKPVVVNAPLGETALSHHRLFRQLIENGGIQLIPAGADIGQAADAVLTAREKDIRPTDFAGEISALWEDVIAKIDGKAR